MKVYDYGSGVFTRGVPSRAHVPELVAGGWSVLSLVLVDLPHLEELPRWGRMPLSDGRLIPEQLARAEHAARWVLRHREHGPVLVHCMAGRNRSVFVAGLAVSAVTGLYGAELVAHLDSVRPGCLANEYFRLHLHRLTAPFPEEE